MNDNTNHPRHALPLWRENDPTWRCRAAKTPMQKGKMARKQLMRRYLIAKLVGGTNAMAMSENATIIHMTMSLR